MHYHDVMSFLMILSHRARIGHSVLHSHNKFTMKVKPVQLT